MKIWITKDSEVSIREQLSAQITLGIVAGDFPVGAKLPSTQEIARRCAIHANTVGAVYRSLVNQSLLEFRPGSGFYVAESAAKSIEGVHRLDFLVEQFLESVGELGFTRDEALRRIKARRVIPKNDRAILIEPNKDLRDIVLYELSSAGIAVSGADYDDLSGGRVPRRCLLTALFDEKPKLEGMLDGAHKCVYMTGRSVSAAMSEQPRPAPGDIIAVVSGWDGFLTFARIILLAANIDPGNLIVRSTADADWQLAISRASIVICDPLTASMLNGRSGVRSFQIISDESVAELRSNF